MAQNSDFSIGKVYMEDESWRNYYRNLEMNKVKIELSEATDEILTRLTAGFGIKSREDVILKALHLLNSVKTNCEDGRVEFFARNPKTGREVPLMLPFLWRGK